MAKETWAETKRQNKINKIFSHHKSDKRLKSGDM